jgi:Fe-S cluster biogenesis protein NfuA
MYGFSLEHVQRALFAVRSEAMFIQTESTPNPATLKFIPGRDVMGAGAVADFPDRESAGRSPLAAALFQIPDVGRVFFGADFVSVTKTDGDWRHLKPAILGAIMEHFTRGLPLMSGAAAEDVERPAAYSEADADIVDQIKELIETRVRPAVAGDGGDIIFRGYRDGIVRLHMQGACSGCPSSRATLKHGIENMLRHYVPEVQSVEQVEI